MNKKIFLIAMLSGFILFSCQNQKPKTDSKPVNKDVSVEKTYVGDLEFQDQTITKATAKNLHKQMALQRATQLVGWAIPMMNFYQLYPAMLSNQKMTETDIFFNLCDGYEGVYPYMTANVTTPYTIGMSDLSITGPLVVDIPAGAIYGVINDAWMQPI